MVFFGETPKVVVERADRDLDVMRFRNFHDLFDLTRISPDIRAEFADILAPFSCQSLIPRPGHCPLVHRFGGLPQFVER